MYANAVLQLRNWTSIYLTIGGEPKLSADNRGILMSPRVITHSPISSSCTHFNSSNTEFIIDQIVGHGRDCAVIVYAESYSIIRAESYIVKKIQSLDEDCTNNVSI